MRIELPPPRAKAARRGPRVLGSAALLVGTQAMRLPRTHSTRLAVLDIRSGQALEGRGSPGGGFFHVGEGQAGLPDGFEGDHGDRVQGLACVLQLADWERRAG